MRLKGFLVKEIAGEIGISETTVKTHLSIAYAKLNVHNVGELSRVWRDSL